FSRDWSSDVCSSDLAGRSCGRVGARGRARRRRPAYTPGPLVTLRGDRMRITVDQDKCCGAGQCVLTAPEVFDQSDEDGVVVLLQPEPGEEHHAAVREAAAVCPASAITVSED